MPSEKLLPCELCGEPTPSLGTRRCDRCWELETRIDAAPGLAVKILDTRARPSVSEEEARRKLVEALDLVEQYARPDYYAWLLGDYSGQKSDPTERATKAKEILRALLNGKEQG